MVKVLIYSSKEIYDTATYEGRAEAHFVAYQENGWYQIVKNRTGRYLGPYIRFYVLERELDCMERDEFARELKNYKLAQSYKDHPNVELMKNSA